MEHIIKSIAIGLIVIAVDYKRPYELSPKIFSKDWWMITLMISLAVILLKI